MYSFIFQQSVAFYVGIGKFTVFYEENSDTQQQNTESDNYNYKKKKDPHKASPEF